MTRHCGDVVLKHHMIKGHRCDVRKALSKEEMRDSRFSGGGNVFNLDTAAAA